MIISQDVVEKIRFILKDETAMRYSDAEIKIIVDIVRVLVIADTIV